MKNKQARTDLEPQLQQIVWPTQLQPNRNLLSIWGRHRRNNFELRSPHQKLGHLHLADDPRQPSLVSSENRRPPKNHWSRHFNRSFTPPKKSVVLGAPWNRQFTFGNSFGLPKLLTTCSSVEDHQEDLGPSVAYPHQALKHLSNMGSVVFRYLKTQHITLTSH